MLIGEIRSDAFVGSNIKMLPSNDEVWTVFRWLGFDIQIMSYDVLTQLKALGRLPFSKVEVTWRKVS